MRIRFLRAAGLLSLLCFSSLAFASAYDARPRLVVIIIADGFRADFLERHRAGFGAGGFNTFLERGAVFADCRYDHAVSLTAPSYTTLLTGAYADGHGIQSNNLWDPKLKQMVPAEQDDATTGVGTRAGGSPWRMLASTLGDELKLATGGKSRVFAVSLKRRAAILPAGRAADAAYWAADSEGSFVTSSYYMKDPPEWVKTFNAGGRLDKYRSLEWKDGAGNVLRPPSASGKFKDSIGETPFATEYQLEFTRQLIQEEKLGSGPATDLLILSLSAPDYLGHDAGPDSPEMAAMILALDRQLSEFFAYLARQFGLANLWLVFTSDHGTAPLPATAAGLRLPGRNVDVSAFRNQANAALAARFGVRADFIAGIDWPVAYLSPDAFAATHLSEAEAEKAAGEALQKAGGWTGFFTRYQIENGVLPPTALGRRVAHSFSPYGGWYVIGLPERYAAGMSRGTHHGSPWSYDTHVPLLFYGLPFRPGVYRQSVEPVDLAPTLASLLGITPPSHSVGRVLSEALADGGKP
ncbi:MAG TPA: alkaline phosphatase family protein [Terriglobales bacterium]|nr:alkaline phosphatase family protein [Terriglobales bacterium]